MPSGRRAIHIAGIAHGPGRPAGSRIANIVISANLIGRDPETGEVPAEPTAQMEALFQTMLRFLDAADVTVDDVIRVNVTVSQAEYRGLLNVEWAKYFNHEGSLPVRKTSIAPLSGNVIAELDLMAVAS
jgi:enamine deaminase RidA (YjgF/YER057c/UK114 family)